MILPPGNLPVTPPTPVKAFATGVLAVGIGGGSLCAMRTVECLGYGEGASGAGSGFFPSPVTMPDLSGASTLSMSYLSGCAIAAGGRLVCWGANYAGQLGDGTMNDSNVPVQVSGLTSGVTSVAVSQEYACAVTSGGGVVCWGNNDSQQLGNGSMTSSLVPVPVTGLESGATAVAVSGTDPPIHLRAHDEQSCRRRHSPDASNEKRKATDEQLAAGAGHVLQSTLCAEHPSTLAACPATCPASA